MSQGSYNVPTGGSVSMVTFAGLMNAAYNALASQNSGASAPANGPGAAAQEFQTWFNTTDVNFPIFNFYDGVNWNRAGTLDVANSNWLPKMGGGVVTLASAATVNIGASPQTYVVITGSTTITSFGTAATVGEERKLQFTAECSITYNAGAIVTPGLANIVAHSGDTCTAVYQGSNIWFLFGFTRGLSPPGFSLPTGATFWMPTAGVAVTGAVRCNGLTIGNASSGGTELASATADVLFSFLYNNFSNTVLPVSGGRTGNSSNDFAANKTIQLPDLRGRVMAGLDDMGNSAASRLTSLTMTPDGVTALATGGGQTVTLIQANLPSYNLTVTDPTHTHNVQGAPNLSAAGIVGGAAVWNAASATTSTSNATGITVASAGSSTATKVVQPTAVGTIYICL